MVRMIIAALALAVASFAADVSGKWVFNVELDAGSGTPTFVFEQSGEKLTGTYAGAAGSAKVAGTVKGDTIEFRFTANLDGSELDVIYSGKITDADSMSGKADYGGATSGTWTAKRAK